MTSGDREQSLIQGGRPCSTAQYFSQQVLHMLTLIRYRHGVPDTTRVQDSPDREGIELRRLQLEQKEESKSSFAPPATSSDLKNSRDIEIAILGLQEVMGYYWLDMEGLVLVSLLSVRARRIASNGRYWRSAVRATFPMHPFEV